MKLFSFSAYITHRISNTAILLLKLIVDYPFVLTEFDEVNVFFCFVGYINYDYKLFCSRAKTVNENLKMNAALLSRFDLIFILVDKPDELLDKRLSDHIMAVSHHISLSLYAVFIIVIIDQWLP